MENFTVYRVYNESGRISGKFQKLTLADLSAGDVLIRVEYSSVNYKDALAVTGRGKIIRRFPLVGGVDCAGKVESSSDPRFSKGQAVVVTGYGLGVDHDGGYAEYVRVPAEWVVPLSKKLTSWDAMAIGTAGFTAALSILRMESNGLQPVNGPVAVTGATGGVGSLAISILAQRGYSVTAITGKPEQAAYLRQLGAGEVQSRTELSMGCQPLEKGLWAGAIDSVGGEMLAWLTRTVQPYGVIASCGLVGGTDLHTSIMPFILRAISLLGISASSTPMTQRLQVWDYLADSMRPTHLEDIAHTIPFDRLEAALMTLLEGKALGRCVVSIL